MKKFDHVKNHREGYVLGSVMMAGALLLLLTLTALSSASSLYHRNVEELNQVQVRLTARSVLDLVTDGLVYPEKGSEIYSGIMSHLEEYLPSDENQGDVYDTVPQTAALPDLVFHLPDSMGACTVLGLYEPEDRKLVLTAKAFKGSSEETVSVYLQYDPPQSGDKKWRILYYGPGEELTP